MKKQLALLIITILLSQSFVLAATDPYAKAYNDMQTVKEFYPLMAEKSEDSITLTADPDYQKQISAFDFNDVNGKQKAEAIRLAMQGITAGVGNKKFAPQDKITNIAALTMFVRLFGDQEALVDKVTAEYGEAPAKYFYSALEDAYYEEAKKLGIMDSDEEVPFQQLASRQNIARWLVNGAKLNLEDAGREYFQTLNWKATEPRNIVPIKTVLEKNLMQAEGNSFQPQQSYTRQQMAELIGNYYDQFLAQKEDKKDDNFTENYAIVIAKKNNAISGKKTYQLRTADNQLVEIELDQKGEKSGFAVYKNGKLSDDSVLALNDEIVYYSEGDMIKYARVVEPFTVTRRLIANLADKQKLVYHQGLVLSNLQETDSSDGNILKTRLRVKLDNNAVVDLVSSYDKLNNRIDSYPIFSKNSYIVADKVPVKSAISIYTVDNKIVYANLGAQPLRSVKGRIREIVEASNPRSISIFDGQKIVKARLEDDATIAVNYYSASLKDLKVGVYAEMILIGDRIKSIHALSYQPAAGKIPAGGKIVYGDIQQINGNSLTVDGQVYQLSPDTAIKKNNNFISASDLRVGDSLKLSLNDINSNLLSKVDVGFDNQLKYLLKGKLYNYNQYTNQIEFAELAKMENTFFEKEKSVLSQLYVMADKAEIYDGEKQLKPSDLNKDYIQREAYFVIREQYGEKQVLKVIFKDGFERHYNSAVADHNNLLQQMELANNNNINYGKQTIFIKNGRLVDQDALQNKDAVYVLANNKNGLDEAKVISIVDDNSRIFTNLYIASLETVNRYDIILDNYTTVNNFQLLKAKRGAKTLYISDDSKIYNLSTAKMLSREQFFNDSYSSQENKKGSRNNHYYGIFVTDGNDNLVAANLRYKGWLKNKPIDDKIKSTNAVVNELNNMLFDTRFSKGQIVAFDQQWKRVELTNPANYIKYYGEWRNSENNIFVELGDAVIMKAGKRIAFSDLKLGDQISLLRHDEDALVVYVQ